MSRRTGARLAWSLYGLTICLAIVWPAGANLLGRDESHDARRNAVQLAGEALVSIATPVVFALVAALILSRQPRNTVGWLLMVPVGAYLVGGTLENRIERLAPSSPEPTVPLLLMVWFSSWGWLLLIFPLLLVLLLFPDGRPPAPRWRLVGAAALVWAALFVLLATFAQQIREPHLVLENPIGVLGQDAVRLLAGAWVGGVLGLVVACAAALFVRYRRTNDAEREQIKWLLYACALFLVVYLGGTLSGLGGSKSFGGYIWQVFFGLSLVGIPAAIGVAILRYRLYEIDVVINRTLVYGSLTAMLVAAYFGCVVGLQYVFRALIGQESQVAVVVSTLVIAASFDPLRRRIQAIVDRRFYRRKYDARKVLEAFSSKLRDETDLELLDKNLVGLVKETVQPEHASLWLRPPKPARFARRVVKDAEEK
jgi:hypothetical protein